MLRRCVPNDNSCLFYAIAYLSEGAEAGREVQQRLRGVVADAVLADPDPDTRAIFLGMPVQEYAAWIRDQFHWGGENEIVVLAEHFKLEVAVVSCETMSTMVYGRGPTATRGRIYLLYTGQHYDPLVAASTPSCSVAEETKVLPLGDDPSLEQSALAIAKKHLDDAARKAAQRRVKKIKCGGCGALLENSQAFQEHCMDESVQHGDDFAYDCSEVEVVYEDGDKLPEGMLDLTDTAKVHTFYNSKAYGFANCYPAAVRLDDLDYPTGEHAWHSLRFAGSAPDLAAKVRRADTVDAAVALAHAEGMDRQRPDWDDARYEVLKGIVRAKFQQHASLRQELLATQDRLIVSVDTDQWAGMSAAGGIPVGQNNMGKALMEVREELRGASKMCD